jgi:hypothetical protein
VAWEYFGAEMVNPVPDFLVNLRNLILFYVLPVSLIHYAILRYNDLARTRLYRYYFWASPVGVVLFTLGVTLTSYTVILNYGSVVYEYNFLIDIVPLPYRWYLYAGPIIGLLGMFCFVTAFFGLFLQWSYEWAGESRWFS